jgi:hypothetical protein
MFLIKGMVSPNEENEQETLFLCPTPTQIFIIITCPKYTQLHVLNIRRFSFLSLSTEEM